MRNENLQGYAITISDLSKTSTMYLHVSGTLFLRYHYMVIRRYIVNGNFEES